MSERRRVGVILGGSSPEREVSLATGAAMAEAARGGGFEVIEIDWQEGSVDELTGAPMEVALLALHGGYGEDGSVQGLLNCLGIPYTGSGVLASALAMHKVQSKRLFVSAGLSTPPYQVMSAAAVADHLAGRARVRLSVPCVVKPAREGSSVGVTIVDDFDGLDEALAAAAEGRRDVLVERFIEGREVSVGVFDGEVLGSVEIVPAEGFYDYRAKYQRKDTRYLLPPELDADVLQAVETTARRAYELLGCRGVARVDLIVSGEEPAQAATEGFGGGVERGWLLEVNTLPGMTETSLVPKMAAARGISFTDLVTQMIEAAQVDVV